MKIFNNFSFSLVMYQRIVGALMLFGHGIPKLMALPGILNRFPDPLGVGVKTSFFLAVFAEVVGSLGLILNWKSRFFAGILFFMMGVAALTVHHGAPWGTKEVAVLYALSYAFILLNGPVKKNKD